MLKQFIWELPDSLDKSWTSWALPLCWALELPNLAKKWEESFLNYFELPLTPAGQVAVYAKKYFIDLTQ